MAITAYTGLPGTGKSYGVVKYVILPALEKGRRIFCNIPLRLDLLPEHKQLLITQFSVQDIKDNPQYFENVFQPGATIVIDECWDLWPAGLKSTDLLEDHKNFLAKHRHMVGDDGNSTEIVLVTQDLAQIATYPRGLVETTYRSEKLIQVGRDKNYRIDIYRGAASGPNPSEKLRIRQLFGKYEPSVYKYYTSQTMSQSDAHGDETRTDTRTNILASKWLKIGAPAFFVIVAGYIYYASSAVTDMYNPEGDPQPIASTLTPETEIKPQPDLGQKTPITADQKPEPNTTNQHFFTGLQPYIAWNNGKYPWIEFKIGFTDGERTVVLTPGELGHLGYSFVAYDSCFAQLKRLKETINIFCSRPDDDSQSTDIIQL